MKKLLVTSLALAALGAAPALAADLERAPYNYRAPPPAVAVCIWCGFYIGGTIGLGWSIESYATAPTGTLVTTPFDGSLGWGAALTGTSKTGLTGGGQIGFNWQSGPAVFGVEADIQYYGVRVTNNSSFVAALPPFGPDGPATVANSVVSKTPWFGTVRGRIGFAASSGFLVYGTGGFAYGREDINATVTATTPA